ncbi:MAG: CARDB domain-containing protein [Melioribacteraceae bacterium]|nr:CARDB domain-containing protein [Melioribacteraceae bacterium]
MSKVDSINISINSDIFWILIGIILLALYSWYFYKFTIPAISSSLKIFLIAIRSLVIILTLILIFEPNLSIKYVDTIEPVNFLFIDNSSSLAVKDSSQRAESLNKLIDDLTSANSYSSKKYLFGIKPREIDQKENSSINFEEPLTNFNRIFETLKLTKDNVGSIVIASDGIITDGYEPFYEAEKFSVPVFTVGLGDTTTRRDLIIKDVIYNQFIYADTQTEIEAIIVNYGYEERNIKVSLYEEDNLIQTKDVSLLPAGVNKVLFDYTPSTSGEKKLRVAVANLPDESNSANNSKIFYLDILKNKIKITIIAGSPSSDLSAISSSLSADKNLEVKKIIQIGSNKFWEELNLTLADSSDLLFLIDFPKQNTPVSLIEKIFSLIRRNKPFFLLVTPHTDLNRLKPYEALLPFSINKIDNETLPVQPEIITANFNSIFSRLSSENFIWSSLPPISKNSSEMFAKTESTILLRSTVRNIPINSPLLISRSIAKQRSISFLAGDLWRWQLSTAEKNPLFFQNFINDIVKWLNVSGEQKEFTVRTNKKIYSTGETAEFIAELYDQTFSPINGANINLNISNGNTILEVTLTELKDGIYHGSFDLLEDGDYTIDAITKFNGTNLTSEKVRFIVTKGVIEMLDTKMNLGFLKKLAGISGGKYYPIDSYDSLIADINMINMKASKDKTSFNEIGLWSNKWIMVLIICLFAVEWFVRKRVGML